MAETKTVCFTGHREIPSADASALRKRLDLVLNALYTLGYRHFISGGALGFDLLAAEEVIALRAEHTDVRLEFAIPFPRQCAAWPKAEQVRYEKLLYRADKISPLAPHYFHGAYLQRNRYMVDRSAVCIAYFNGSPTGGTSFTACYALRKDLRVINIFDDEITAEGLRTLLTEQAKTAL